MRHINTAELFQFVHNFMHKKNLRGNMTSDQLLHVRFHDPLLRVIVRCGKL